MILFFVCVVSYKAKSLGFPSAEMRGPLADISSLRCGLLPIRPRLRHVISGSNFGALVKSVLGD